MSHWRSWVINWAYWYHSDKGLLWLKTGCTYFLGFPTDYTTPLTWGTYSWVPISPYLPSLLVDYFSPTTHRRWSFLTVVAYLPLLALGLFVMTRTWFDGYPWIVASSVEWGVSSTHWARWWVTVQSPTTSRAGSALVLMWIASTSTNQCLTIYCHTTTIASNSHLKWEYTCINPIPYLRLLLILPID